MPPSIASHALGIQELLDCVVEHLRTDTTSLHQASRVSRQWRATITPVLFRRIAVRTGGFDRVPDPGLSGSTFAGIAGKVFLARLPGDPGLAGLVECLCLCGFDEQTAGNLLRRCVNLRELHIRSSWICITPAFIAGVHLAHVTSLTLETSDVRMTGVQALRLKDLLQDRLRTLTVIARRVTYYNQRLLGDALAVGGSAVTRLAIRDLPVLEPRDLNIMHRAMPNVLQLELSGKGVHTACPLEGNGALYLPLHPGLHTLRMDKCTMSVAAGVLKALADSAYLPHLRQVPHISLSKMGRDRMPKLSKVERSVQAAIKGLQQRQYCSVSEKAEMEMLVCLQHGEEDMGGTL